MLEYEWGTHFLSADDHGGGDPSSDHHHRHSQFYDPFSDPTQILNPTQIINFQTPQFPQFAGYPPFPHSTQYQLQPDPAQYMMVPKPEPEFATRIGLNLGGRTYFSSAESDFVNRLYRRSRPVDSGSVNVARCQAEGCCADLTHAKHYHRRHKVCEFHSKAAAVVAAGITQRFCQQCSRFHLLTEFDNGKRSCRKRLADHNRRRRKSNNQANINNEQQQQTPKSDNEIALVDSPSDNLPMSSQDSGTQSTSSVTVAVSPPRFSLDCFKQRSYQAAAAAAATSSPSTSSLFFSNE